MNTMPDCWEPSDVCVVVTGGARGIGAATARELVQLGAKVAITDVLDTEGKALAEELGDNAIFLHHDVTSPEDWQDVIVKTLAVFGKINALVNNAGIVFFGAIAKGELADFKKTIDVNLYGVFLGMHFVSPVIDQAGGGVIVNVSSTAGLQGYAGISAYVASKWGVRGLTKAAALDLARKKIRVLSVHPGPIRTPMTSQMDESMTATQPIPRFGEPEEVARMIRFMIIEATYSTGGEFIIDGGAVTGLMAPVSES
jgi:3alpha(or 20beta)-hydroxysteroid dehydrogenase